MIREHQMARHEMENMAREVEEYRLEGRLRRDGAPARGPTGEEAHEWRRSSSDRALLSLVAVLSLAACLVQLRMVPQHFEGWWVYGALFLAAALAQSVYVTVLLLWPGDRVLLAGIAGNSLVVAAYLAAGTPDAGASGVLDALPVVLEAGVMVALGCLLLLARLRRVGAVPEALAPRGPAARAAYGSSPRA